MCSKIVVEISVHGLIHKYMAAESHPYLLWNAQCSSTFSDPQRSHCKPFKIMIVIKNDSWKYV